MIPEWACVTNSDLRRASEVPSPMYSTVDGGTFFSSGEHVYRDRDQMEKRCIAPAKHSKFHFIDGTANAPHHLSIEFNGGLSPVPIVRS
jgi:hypothetical protein